MRKDPHEIEAKIREIEEHIATQNKLKRDLQGMLPKKKKGKERSLRYSFSCFLRKNGDPLCGLLVLLLVLTFGILACVAKATQHKQKKGYLSSTMPKKQPYRG